MLVMVMTVVAPLQVQHRVRVDVVVRERAPLHQKRACKGQPLQPWRDQLLHWDQRLHMINGGMGG